MKPTTPLHTVIAFAISLLTSALAQIEVNSVVWPSSSSIEITFNADPDASLEAFAVQVSSTPDRSSPSWSLFGDVQIAAMPDNRWRATIPVDPSAPRRFFRVLKDGVPIVSTGSAKEGSAGGLDVHFSKPFTGTLDYTVSLADGSPPQTGQLTVDGTSARVPVTLPDDTRAGTLNYLTLSLSAEDGVASYTVGGGTPFTVTIDDDDAAWAGLLFFGSPEDTTSESLPVRILVADSSTESIRCLTTAGTGLLPANPDHPDGCWPFAAGFSLDSSDFTAAVSVTVPASETLYAGDTDITISFLPGATVTATQIDGEFSLTTTVAGKPHLNIPTRTGSYSLVKQPVTSAPAAPLADR